MSVLHQGYQLAAHVLDGCVHQRDLEFTSRRELFPGGRQPAVHDLGRLGAAAGEPAHQLVPRRRGEEYQPGVICIGAAIRDHNGAVVGAISASTPTMRASEPHLTLVREQVTAAVRALSAELGLPGSQAPVTRPNANS